MRLLRNGLGGLGLAISIISAGLAAQANPFERGWDLSADGSALQFQSIKNNSKVETSSFATLIGGIESDGTATVRVLLESVDTKVDLRNVRMRFLFFETFMFPEAVATMSLTPAEFEDLEQVRRKVVALPFELDLHGVKKEMTAKLAVTLLTDDMVSVSSFEPIKIELADFDLLGGISKLEEAANVDILPSTTVTFDFLFSRRGTQAEQLASGATIPAATLTPVSAALETQGELSREECEARFQTLSRTDNISFASGSSRLSPSSRPLLDSLVDIVRRCPSLVIEVSGHTDSDGGAANNLRLSEARAGSVSRYLTENGISGARIVTVGYGETRPIVPNDSPANKKRNRRIEFAVLVR